MDRPPPQRIRLGMRRMRDGMSRESSVLVQRILSRSVSRLVERGLIEKSSDETDRRQRGDSPDPQGEGGAERSGRTSS